MSALRTATAQAAIGALLQAGLEVRDELQYDDGTTVLYVLNPAKGHLETIKVADSYPNAILAGPLLEMTEYAGATGQGEADL